MSFGGEVTRRYFVDNGAKTVTFVNVQDSEPILDANARAREQEQTGDMQLHSRIPNTKLLEWFYEEDRRGNKMRMFSKEWDMFVWKKLQDPDNKYLLCRKPKLIIPGCADVA